MRVLVSGSTGLVGTRLVAYLKECEHAVVRLTRADGEFFEPHIAWNPQLYQIDAEALKGIDAVIHLAGAGVADGNWSTERKTLIRDSRVEGTRLLCETLAQLETPPKVLISASAIGFYGNRSDETCTEETTSGEGFLAGVCTEWEGATKIAEEAGIRVAHARIGLVLSADGGALAKMLTPFRTGMGGVVGPGTQYMSWIAIEDAVRALVYIMDHKTLAGPVNVVGPQPATNREFTHALGHALSRPTLVPLPAFAARLMLGSEMAEELILSSTKVIPQRLKDAGFEFRYPELEAALRHAVDNPSSA